MTTFIVIIIAHYIADFVLQKGQWATNKSKAVGDLLKHTATYSVMWFLPVFIFGGVLSGDNSFGEIILDTISFVAITFIFHTLTDYITSKVVSKKFEDKQYYTPLPNFGAFSMIGLDQVFHYLQLIITWNYLFGI